MATITGFTAERMLVIENETVIDGEVQGDNLHLIQRGGVVIDAGNVRGPKGDTGPQGTPGTNGTNGLGVPAGGATGLILTKNSPNDNDTSWKTLASAALGIPAPVTSGSTIQSYTDPLGEVWVAKNGVNSGNWKKAKDVIRARYSRTSAWTVQTTITNVTLDTLIYDDYGLYTGGLFHCPIPGFYRVGLNAAGSSAGANNSITTTAVKTGVSVQSVNSLNASAASQILTASLQDVIVCTATDTLGMSATAWNVTFAGSTNQTFGNFEYLGPRT